jgi:acetyltransferase-like isoleucine patch superfamily enzyme
MPAYSILRGIKKIKNRIRLFISRKIKKSVYTKDLLKADFLTVGDFTYGTPDILRFPNGENGKVFIGKFCSIAIDVKIFTGGNHRIDWVSTFPFNQFGKSFPSAEGILGQPSTKGDVIIGNDVWIGQGAIILSGIKIGDGAVIGAYTLVAKDVEPYAVVVGNPMKIIKKRFDEETIEKLLHIKWWNWDIAKIKTEVQNLCSDNISNFIAKHK